MDFGYLYLDTKQSRAQISPINGRVGRTTILFERGTHEGTQSNPVEKRRWFREYPADAIAPQESLSVTILSGTGVYLGALGNRDNPAPPEHH